MSDVITTATPALLELFGGGDLSKFTEMILAIGGLGLASAAVVDASKASKWGIARVGFHIIEDALQPYAKALEAVDGALWPDLLMAHWINGREKAEQKALAVSMVMLGLSAKVAESVCDTSLIDATALGTALTNLQKGEGALTETDISVIGRFRTLLDARVEAAFERAEQKYRNVARVWSGGVAIALAVAVTAVSSSDLNTARFLEALAIGVFAVPLAPIAKDLAGGLTAAARALKLGR